MAKIRGQLIKVNGKNMYISRVGSGGKTIVLMPGWGVPLPSVDFAPLMRELSQKDTICTIEFFGYGRSDSTDRPHTNENYVQEIRETLKFAGLKPPYVLMPHSCAGIYCEYYAIKYPNEVEGLILLDTSPTVEGFAEKLALRKKDLEKLSVQPSKFAMWINKVLVSMIVRIMGEKQEHIKAGYTKDEVIALSTTPNHMCTLAAQYRALPDNLCEVAELEARMDIPILLLFSGEVKADAEHEKYRKAHLEKLGERAKNIVIEGSTHTDIYWRREFRKIICQEAEVFLGLLTN